ncbi:ATP-binding cassette domain-containing protein [Methanosarcina barkeri]|uniref:ATP-binding cassette domain-containing protein n=1 Tax=Methanosarcina barkeri TaxID=2208 RepID=UPI000AFF47F3|nr:ATP-binding cassette domain-containing protein [Methanosarcina barkeri]
MDYEASIVPSYENVLKRLAELLQVPATRQLENHRWQKPETSGSILPSEENLPFVRIENLYYRPEDGSEILKNINLNIKSGEFLALLGHNGAGKTTLAGHLIGFYRPSFGRILLNGKDIERYSTAQLSKKKSGIFSRIQIRRYLWIV